MVGALGIEPSQHAPKACVLPVYDAPYFAVKNKPVTSITWVYFLIYNVPRVRIELTTQGFSVLCSTTELPRHILLLMLRGSDSNRRPLGYGPSELPTALPRYNILIRFADWRKADWWAMEDSNLRPQHYQCCALTN